MSVVINSFDKIVKDLNIDEEGYGMQAFTNECVRRMDKYVPMDEGDLRTNINITKHSVTYESPYASYQYYGIRADGTRKVQHYTTAGTGPKWDERMKSAEIEEITEFMGTLLGRK